jgi:hypothetical protein
LSELSANLPSRQKEVAEPYHGALTLFEVGSSMKLSPDETYNLLVWLNDNYHDRLHALTGHTQQEGKPTPDYDVRNPQQESAWREWAKQASVDELLAALRRCSSSSVVPAQVTRDVLQQRGYVLVGGQPHEVMGQQGQEENP